MIDPKLLEILACPLHPERPPLRLEGEYLICTLEGHGFPIVDGIPHLLPTSVIPKEKMEELLRER